MHYKRLCEGDLELFDFDDNSTLAFLRELSSLHSSFTVIHRYLSATICMIGIAFSIMHLIVLTRKRRRSSAVNNILAAIAFCDILTMTTYLTFILRFKIFTEETDAIGVAFAWTAFQYVHVVNSITMHAASLYLCSLAAFVRWISIERLNSVWAERRRVWLMIAIIFVAMGFSAVPTIIVHKIHTVSADVAKGLYFLGLNINFDNGCRLLKIYEWQTGIFFKVIPCVLLFFFTIGLLQKLREAKKRLRSLMAGRYAAQQASNRDRERDRTTAMLFFMLTIFLVTELPQGALVILDALFTSDVHVQVYAKLSELNDLLSLINSNVGYILYPAMSATYRAAFRDIFMPTISTTSSSSTSKTL